jgi:hypothetical protein
VVKQLPVEMLQQCLSKSSCMQTCIVMQEHHTVMSASHAFCSEWPALHSFLSVLQYTSNFILFLVAWIPPSALPPCPGRVTICLLAGRHLFKTFWLVWWISVHPPLWLLSGFNVHKWNPGFITCYSYNVVEKDIAIFVVSL